MAKYLVMGEIVTPLHRVVEADNEREAHDLILDGGPERVLGTSHKGSRFEHLSIVPWHDFDTAKAKELVPGLSAEDAETVVSLANEAYREGASDHPPASYRETESWRAGVASRVRLLEDRLGLDGEIEAIFEDAFVEGFSASR